MIHKGWKPFVLRVIKRKECLFTSEDSFPTQLIYVPHLFMLTQGDYYSVLEQFML